MRRGGSQDGWLGPGQVRPCLSAAVHEESAVRNGLLAAGSLRRTTNPTPLPSELVDHVASQWSTSDILGLSASL